MAGDRSEVLGAVAVVPIPFTAREEIDEESLRALIEFAIRIGLRAVCLPAYGSEFYKLSDRERLRVVRVAVEQARGRLLVFAQSNHGSARVAADFAGQNAAAGADYVSIAIPRQFAIPREDLLQHLATVLGRVPVPCLVQDFNPGGVTLDSDFVRALKERCPNFRYLKLEEPVMAPKIQVIRAAVGESVGILEGWGGMYMMELVPLGICGLMPGLAIADILNRIYHWRREGRAEEAFSLFEKVLPQIVFSLQNLELFLYCEKRLLEARGLLPNHVCRSPAYTPDGDTAAYVDELNRRILRTLDQLQPAAAAR